MDDRGLYELVLDLHLISGMVAFFVAPIAMVVRKGGRWHRLWGKTYVWSMVAVVATVFWASFYEPNYIMMLVGLLSIYLILSGYRALYLKKLSQGQRPDVMDYLLHSAAALVNFGLLVWGASVAFFDGGAFPLIVVVFGVIGSIFVFINIRKFFKRRMHKQDWWFSHMAGMLGGYIATVSAFSAVNFHFIPEELMWLRWLWPTIIGSPLIALWVRHYRKKFAGGKSPRRYARIEIGKRPGKGR